MELLPQDFNLGGKKVLFVHADGTTATHAVGTMGTDSDGGLMFWELQGMLDDGKINGKEKYARLQIQRVFPCVEC